MAAALLAAAISGFAAVANATADEHAPRTLFLTAEKAVAAGDEDTARSLLEQLQGYPLAPHIALALAEAELQQIPHAAVEELVRRHADVPGVERLRRDWLERLEKEGRFELLLENFVDDGHLPSACRAANAELRTGATAAAWRRIAALWPTGKSLPDECDPVIAAWRAAGRLDEALLWERVSLAMNAGNVRLARYLAKQLQPPARDLAQSWLRLRDRPEELPAFARDTRTAPRHRDAIVLHVFSRTASRNTTLARRLWPKLDAAPLPEALRATLRERLGTALAKQRAPDALDWLQQARGVPALTARAVEGIRIGRLDDVAAAIAAMPAEEAGRERWRFWAARGLEGKDPAGARERMNALAAERSYYGFLAADRTGRNYAFGDVPIAADAARRETLARMPGVVRAREWLALDRPEDARREWTRLLAGLDRDEQLAAATLVHGWNWHEAAIRAAAAAQHWSDLALRFPLAHADEVARAAEGSQLRASRIYAVVRQESAFMRDIRSSAGALGLMQLMPATARQVARRESLPRPSRNTLLTPGPNLVIGSLYLQRLERRYDSHTVLATAAYNAGPGRVQDWRPEQSAMPSDVWIELIPFRETRRYVRSVLAYQIIYAARLDEPAIRITTLMPDVPAS